MTTFDINAIHVPADAGEHAEALTAIMQRIPDGWGRWISTGPGWYPIIVNLDSYLSRIVPGYQIQQVKEKFGGLRFYWSWPEDTDEHTHRGAETLVEAAEIMSRYTCEKCGSHEAVPCIRGTWLKTLCAACAAESDYDEVTK